MIESADRAKDTSEQKSNKTIRNHQSFPQEIGTLASNFFAYSTKNRFLFHCQVHKLKLTGVLL